MKRQKLNKNGLMDAVYLGWEESERGWGVRPEGCSLHTSKENLEEFVEDSWRDMPQEVPDEYSRPAGEPVAVRVSKKLYSKIKNNKPGIRVYDEEYLVRNRELVFASTRRTGR